MEYKETIGQILSHTRREKGWDLERIHKETKIPIAGLKALEEDDYDALPSIYLKGAIQKYAQVLGLNYKELINLYKNSNEFVAQQDQSLVPISDHRSISLFSQLRNILIILSKSLVLILVSSYLIYELAMLILPPKIILESPRADLNTNKGTLLVQGKAIRAKSLLLNNQPILIDESKAFKEEIILKPGLNQLEFIAINQLGQKSTLVRNVIYAFP
ncbi:MAG: hypothetical protein BWY48_00095 [Parcubacteria group bacterium ADurb.Bin305]|nr:helix-turn-helix domain-containing protein [Candidatus Paceibacterota bacterium]MDD3434557.1 helix-turn-helix domain-containing protein [Candidatus Paceibacterota bacterium]OQA44351.1 MAG: hypothetical protein BWY48_00095 [Parcubacteria group bacterium ADurb.Bin305]